ncbi:MAG: hypothetical protein ABIK15_04205 [Pseudomonadota bacterium]
MKKRLLQKYTMGLSLIVLFLFTLHRPAYGEPEFQNPNDNNLNALHDKHRSNIFFLFPQDSRKNKHFSLADGFMLCELLTLQHTKLNIYYMKKDVSTKSILDIKRFFLEIKLDF